MKKQKIILPKGVLKVKTGYNPNSSSIGTVIYSFPFMYIIISTVLAILAVWVYGKKGSNNE
jgi:hypothetical protein